MLPLLEDRKFRSCPRRLERSVPEGSGRADDWVVCTVNNRNVHEGSKGQMLGLLIWTPRFKRQPLTTLGRETKEVNIWTEHLTETVKSVSQALGSRLRGTSNISFECTFVENSTYVTE